MIDLYSELGVPRSADRAAIKRAYWLKARQAHPDAGGSVDAFARIKIAHDILTDEIRRRQYDETGEASEQPVNNQRAKVLEMLATGLDLAMLRLSQSGQPPANINMINLIAEVLWEKRHGWSDQVGELGKVAAQSQDLIGRFRVDSGDNLMEAVVAGRISACLSQIETLSTRIQVVDEALQVLNHTAFRPYSEPPFSPDQPYVSLDKTINAQFV